MRPVCLRLDLALVPQPSQHGLVSVQAPRYADEVGREICLRREALDGTQIGAKAQWAGAARWARAAATEFPPRQLQPPNPSGRHESLDRRIGPLGGLAHGPKIAGEDGHETEAHKGQTGGDGRRRTTPEVTFEP